MARLYLCAFLALLPAALVLTECLLYAQNSLYLHDTWIVQKRMMQMGLGGADEYLLSRVPLAQNSLNLGSYYGFQELISRRSAALDELELTVEVPEKSYIDVTYNRSGDNWANSNYHGIRLSRREDQPSFSFVSTSEGRFLVTRKLHAFSLPTAPLTISLKNSPLGLNISVNGTPLSTDGVAKLGDGRVGFRSGMNGAKVHRIAGRSGAGAWFEMSFRNTKNWYSAVVLNFILLSCVAMTLGRRLNGAWFIRGRASLFVWILVGMAGAGCSCLWYAFDYSYYSLLTPKRSPLTRMLFKDEGSESIDLEKLRVSFFEAWYRLAGGELISRAGVIERGYPDNRIFAGPLTCTDAKGPCLEGLPVVDGGTSTKYRVLFVGSSQTVGAGAAKVDDTFFVRTHRWLSLHLDPSHQLESINVAVSSYDSGALIREYRQQYLALKPDLVVINLSSNDNALGDFRENMREFLSINRLQKIKTVLLTEPESIESESRIFLFSKHAVLREVATEFKVPCLEFNEYLAHPKSSDQGALWWDIVHFNSFGHERAADWLAPRLLRIIRLDLRVSGR